MKKTRFRTYGGILEELDEKGEVISRQKPNEKKETQITNSRPTHVVAENDIHQVAMPDGRLVWVQKGISADKLPRKEYPYSDQVAQAILNKVQEGKTLTSISKLSGFPPLYEIYRWKRTYKEFREQLELAKKDAAETFYDKVVDTAESTSSIEESKINAIKTKAYQWAAEKGNHERYGKTTTVKGSESEPIKIVIQTGVPQKEVKEIPTSLEDMKKDYNNWDIPAEYKIAEQDQASDDSDKDN